MKAILKDREIAASDDIVSVGGYEYFPPSAVRLEWLEKAPRPYSEVIEVWRTSCPRLPVWEEANALGFVDRRHRVGSEKAWVSVSAAGQVFLRTRRPQARPPNRPDPHARIGA